MMRLLTELALVSLALASDKCQLETQKSSSACTANSFGCSANGTMCALQKILVPPPSPPLFPGLQADGRLGVMLRYCLVSQG